MTSTIDQGIGRRLRRRREELKLSCDDVGVLVQSSSELIGLYESGEVRVPPGKLIALADALGTSLKFLFFGDDDDIDANTVDRSGPAIRSLTDASVP
jgi:transcriptional regulator with XRE-family HTH domain